MKKIFFTLMAISFTNFAFSQGTQVSGSPIYYNGGTVNIGGFNNSSLVVRHIDGKETNTTASDHLYLNYNNAKHVFVGFGGLNSNLLVSGYLGVGTSSPAYTLSVKGGPSNAQGINIMDANSRIYFDGRRAMEGHYSIGRLDLGEGFSTTQLFGNVGIGITSPLAKLHVEGDILIKSGEKLSWGGTQTAIEGSTVSNKIAFFTNSLERMRVDNGGNVGIGTTSPSAKLSIFQSSNSEWAATLENNGGDGKGLFIKNSSGNTTPSLQINDNYDNIRFIVQSNGNVGIGATNLSEKLNVNGTIRSQKVKVEATGWPDFVFSSNFKLRTLSELESYIKANQHLPEVPSAKEVEENGLDLGKMDATLLQKVEELTLYLIDGNKEKDALKTEVSGLKKENQELKAMLLVLKKEIEALKEKNKD